ncbi:MAG: hypothetical protein VZR95_07415 [Alphaproteobacteria bacterium]
MKKVLKGKIKYNFWIGLGCNVPVFMAVSFVMAVTVVGVLQYFDPQYFAGKVTFAGALSSFAAYMGICYIIARYYRRILSRWDKVGYGILTVDTEARTICFDNTKTIPFAEVESIRFEKCEDSLPRIPKSYDMVNAQAVFKLINGDTLIFCMQKLEWVYGMIKYFRDLHIRVEADEFENNAMYKIQANSWKMILVLVLSVWSYMLYQMHKNGMF